MVHTAVQKIPVMGYQQEAPLSPQVRCHRPPSSSIQMVGGFVDEEIAVLPAEQRRQQALGPLPVGEGIKGAVQGFGIHTQ